MQPLHHNLPQGALFHGRYEVVRRIKAGAMGAVYEVKDRVTDRRLALKVMHPQLLDDVDLLARFEQEARITGKIVSDHLIRVLDSGYESSRGLPFLVMELLHGEELGAMLRRRGALPPDEVLLIISQVALGLERTHAEGIIHRDLKPDNLFLARRDDGTRCVKILDFGIAKVVPRHADTKATQILGTPLYMAPEQFLARTPSPATDTYALAHIAYTLLVGKPYWSKESMRYGVGHFLDMVCAGHLEHPSARAGDGHGIELPGGFDAWFERATSVQPEERFQSASALARALAEVLGLPSPLPEAPDSPVFPLTRRLACSGRAASGDSERESGSVTASATGMSRTVATAGPMRLRGRTALPIAILFGLAALASMVALLHSVGAKQVVPLAAAPGTVEAPVSAAASSSVASANVQPMPGKHAAASVTDPGTLATSPRPPAATSLDCSSPAAPAPRVVRKAAIQEPPGPGAPASPITPPSPRTPQTSRDIF